jgi:pyruvate dehydrogenase E2 component (dihydrolipoamide acetyltransferase)
MSTDVIMPALGMAQETGKVLRWLKAEGEPVRQGEPLLEIETDKATAELEAPATGTLVRVTASAGDEIPVGQVIAVILAPGESPLEASPFPAAPRRQPTIPAAPTPAPAPAAGRGRVPASPRARRLARERGLDLAALQGSGPGGAVQAADIPDDIPATQDCPSAMSTTWRLMAERTTQTWTTTPHFFLVREASAERLMAWRERARANSGADVTYTDLLVRLVAAALRRHPHVNARWEQGGIVRLPAVNLGIAVATEQGLVVPVIHDADRLTVGEIATRRADLVTRAREGRLRPADISGGTFTISNLGMYAVDAFTAILNAPQAAILAVGRIGKRVVVHDGQPAVRSTLVLTLSCDHRVIDGARAARFLEDVADLIEEPAGLIG